MTAPALLDVNLLVALFAPDHVHHEIAHDTFADHRAHGWATCAITENGCLRVPAGLGFDAAQARPDALVTRLRRFCASGHHQFWAESVSLRDRHLFRTEQIRGPRQLTDVYLLGLAKRMDGRLATLDRGIPLNAVIGATRDTLVVVGPA